MKVKGTSRVQDFSGTLELLVVRGGEKGGVEAPFSVEIFFK